MYIWEVFMWRGLSRQEEEACIRFFGWRGVQRERRDRRGALGTAGTWRAKYWGLQTNSS